MDNLVKSVYKFQLEEIRRRVLASEGSREPEQQEVEATPAAHKSGQHGHVAGHHRGRVSTKDRFIVMCADGDRGDLR